MDGRGGCCIARYCGGGGGGGGGVYGSYDMSKVDLIMHRFRPIAPKPVAGGEVSGAGEEMKKKKSEAQARVGGRGKRRQCNGSPNPNPSKRCNKRRKSSSSSSSKSPDRDEYQTVVTLPLLPESPEPKVFSKERIKTLSPTWLSFDEENNNNNIIDVNAFPSYNPDRRVLDDRTVGVGPWRGVRVVGSSVTVECVTDTWTDAVGLGRTDEERRANLERDTCPGFVSDGFGRVTWTNGAYRSMVAGQGGGDLITVWLVMKDRLPAGVTLTYPAFTCRVTLQCHVDGQDVMKKTLPCDVWRLDGGGFAWRLDVKAALCLGR